MSQEYVSDEVLGRIYAATWKDSRFRQLFEEDPTRAIRSFCAENGISIENKRLIKVPDRPQDLSDDHIDSIVTGKERLFYIPPNSCC